MSLDSIYNTPDEFTSQNDEETLKNIAFSSKQKYRLEINESRGKVCTVHIEKVRTNISNEIFILELKVTGVDYPNSNTEQDLSRFTSFLVHNVLKNIYKKYTISHKETTAFSISNTRSSQLKEPFRQKVMDFLRSPVYTITWNEEQPKMKPKPTGVPPQPPVRSSTSYPSTVQPTQQSQMSSTLRKPPLPPRSIVSLANSAVGAKSVVGANSAVGGRKSRTRTTRRRRRKTHRTKA